MRTWIWFGGLTLIAAIILFAQFMHNRTIAEYEKNGESVAGVVEDKEIEKRRESRRRVVTDYYIWVNAEIEGIESKLLVSEYIGSKDFESYEIGQEVEVVYLPEYMYIMEMDEYRDVSFNRPVMLKSMIPVAKARMKWYPVYAGVVFILALLPFVIQKLKSKD